MELIVNDVSIVVAIIILLLKSYFKEGSLKYAMGVSLCTDFKICYDSTKNVQIYNLSEKPKVHIHLLTRFLRQV